MENLKHLLDLLEDHIDVLEIHETHRLDAEIKHFEATYFDDKMFGRCRRRDNPNHVKNLENEVKWMYEQIPFKIFKWRLGIKAKLILALGKFVELTDMVSDIEIERGSKGIEIRMIVTRNGERFDFLTYATPAGGEYIQCFHYRYITKTKLPKSDGNSNLSKVINIKNELEILKWRRTQIENSDSNAKDVLLGRNDNERMKFENKLKKII